MIAQAKKAGARSITTPDGYTFKFGETPKSNGAAPGLDDTPDNIIKQL
jgi:hypothetical protein